MSWPGRTHMAASLADLAPGQRATVCGWVDRYRYFSYSFQIDLFSFCIFAELPRSGLHSALLHAGPAATGPSVLHNKDLDFIVGVSLTTQESRRSAVLRRTGRLRSDPGVFIIGAPTFILCSMSALFVDQIAGNVPQSPGD